MSKEEFKLLVILLGKKQNNSITEYEIDPICYDTCARKFSEASFYTFAFWKRWIVVPGTTEETRVFGFFDQKTGKLERKIECEGKWKRSFWAIRKLWGSIFIAGGWARKMACVDFNNGKFIKAIPVGKSVIYGIVPLEYPIFATCCSLGIISIWNYESGKIVEKIFDSKNVENIFDNNPFESKEESNPLYDIAVSKDDKRWIVASGYKKLVKYDRINKKIGTFGEILGENENINCWGITFIKRHQIFASFNGHICAYDLRNDNQIFHFELEIIQYPYRLICVNENFVIIGGKSICIFDLEKKKIIAHCIGEKNNTNSSCDVLINDKGEVFSIKEFSTKVVKFKSSIIPNGKKSIIQQMKLLNEVNSKFFDIQIQFIID